MANNSLRQLSDALNMATAQLSGDPQRMQMALGLQQSRKLQQQENKLNDWIGENIPEDQQRLLQALSYSDKVKAIVSTQNQQPFEGTGLTNQYLNILEKGKNDPDLRRTTKYRIAYNALTAPKTETYLNEFGQQVRREIPSVAQPGVYPPPISLDAPTAKPDAIPEPTDEDTVLQISPERRKELQTQLDTSQSVLERLDSLDRVIEEYDPGLTTVGTERAIVGSSYNDLLLVLKDYARLGVLAGPDLDLLNNWVGDPMGFKQNILYQGAEGTKVQTDQLRAAILRGEEKLKKQMGLAVETPQGTRTQKNVYLNGRQLILNSEGTGWIYKDTGEPAQ